MAKQKNHERKLTFNGLVNNLKREERPRLIDRVAERRYFLIVTEGEKTEPNYFKGLIDELPDHLVEVEILGRGADTISVVQAAIKRREQAEQQRLKPPFDEVWAVFDKDDFPAKKFNEAVQLAENKQVKVAYSNEAFELWYVLHFEFLNSAVNRAKYIETLKRVLGSYKKNQTGIYRLLKEKGNEAQAIKWAKKLYKELNVGNPAVENPTTLVYDLVERLNKFKL